MDGSIITKSDVSTANREPAAGPLWVTRDEQPKAAHVDWEAPNEPDVQGEDLIMPVGIVPCGLNEATWGQAQAEEYRSESPVIVPTLVTERLGDREETWGKPQGL